MTGRRVKRRAMFNLMVVGCAALLLMLVAASAIGLLGHDGGDDAALRTDLIGSDDVGVRPSVADTSQAAASALRVVVALPSNGEQSNGEPVVVQAARADSTDGEQSDRDQSDVEPIIVQASSADSADDERSEDEPVVVQAADVDTSDGPPVGSIVEVEDPIQGSYLVLFRDAPEAPADTSAQVDAAQAKVDEVMAAVTGEVNHIYRGVLSGFAVEGLNEAEAAMLAGHPAVAFVEQDQVTTASQANPPSWGLDRVDQRNASLDGNYNSFGRTGAGVNVYVLDTGIRSSHQDFGGRVRGSVNFTGDGIGGDCNGHGTHVAGTAAGASYGIAKSANIWDVKVMNCRAEGSTAAIAAALDWVRLSRSGPSVVNMSLSAAGGVPSLEMATEQLVGSGVPVVASSGNGYTDACNSSPARVPSALTVGATDRNDRRLSLSNYGSCVDLFAPGDGIVSAAHTSDTGSVIGTGTSMAAPHVAGVAALFLGSNPNATPAQVEQAIESVATPGVVSDARSANLLLYTGLPDALPTPPEVGNPGGTWTQCATEGGTCSFSGTKVVQYGGGGHYKYFQVTNGIACTNAAFGQDPASGSVKTCSLQATAPPVAGDPGGYWAQCATEGGRCSFSGTKIVQYGAPGRFDYFEVTDGTLCINSAFGKDPAPGTPKTCSLQSNTPPVVSDPGGTWTQCTTEGGRCSFSGTKILQYGAPGRFDYFEVTDGTLCINSAFGKDPAPGSPKTCSLQTGR